MTSSAAATMEPQPSRPVVESADPSPTLLSTGIAPLDDRLGGVARGRHFLLTGAPGAGKTSLALHFIGEGLARGERCAILTQDDPEDVLTHAEFLGYDLRTAAVEERLVLVRFRLDFQRNYARVADPEKIYLELGEQLGSEVPSRLVIDSVLPFMEGAAEERMAPLPRFLKALGCTSYLLVPGELEDPYYRRLYNRIISGAGGIFHLATGEGQGRELTIRKIRQPVTSTEPIRFDIHAGLGVVEQPSGATDLPEEVLRRVVLITEGVELPRTLVSALRLRFDLTEMGRLRNAFGELVSARYGALVVALDPRDPEPAFDLARMLRRSGNGAPILYVSCNHGLRSSTRARGIRAGGDDFLTDALGPEEFLERVEVARTRGHRHSIETSPLEPIVPQPVDEAGEQVSMSEDALHEVVIERVAKAKNPFFALVRIRPAGMGIDDAWEVLRGKLRVGEGDLIARSGDDDLLVYLHDVRREQVDMLLARIAESHPGIGGAERASVICYPTDGAELSRRVPGLSVPAGE